MEAETITVTILDRTYRLKVAHEQALTLKKASELINQTAKQYGHKYFYKDYQDLLAMVSLTQMERLIKIDRLLDTTTPTEGTETTPMGSQTANGNEGNTEA